MLLLSIPTGFLSIKLLYMVQAEIETETKFPEFLFIHFFLFLFIHLSVKVFASFTSFWFHAVDSGLVAAGQLDGGSYASQQPPTATAHDHHIRLRHHLQHLQT